MQDPVEIQNWRRVSDQITTSGQPTEAQLRAIRDLGVAHVVNLGLHTHERALPDEAGSVAGLGMRYSHIPVDFAAPSEGDFSAFCEVMAALGEETVHVHCILNARVSAFFYRYRRDILGQDEAEARRLMETVWRPGGVWAEWIGDRQSVSRDHLYAGVDY